MKRNWLVIPMVVAMAWPVCAQNYQSVAPKTPDAQAPAPVLNPGAATAPAGGEAQTAIIPPLKGAVVLESLEALKPSGAPGVTGLQVQGPAFLKRKDLEKVFAPYWGKPMTESDLSRLQREIIIFCRKQDHPVVDVHYPQQEIVDNVIQMVVYEAKLGKVEVKNEGRKWFKDKMLRGQVRLREGEVITENRLLQDLSWLNRNPYFRQVDVAFKQGKELGGSDIELRVKDRFPVRFFAGYEDSGTKVLGDHRMLAGFNWGNAWGLDHQFNYQFISDVEVKFLKAHAASYVAPLPWRHVLTVFGSYSDIAADLAAINLGRFEQRGESYQASIRYAIPLPKIVKYEHEFSFGFDYKRTDNNLESGGTTFFGNPVEIAQWAAAYRGLLPDAAGVTSFNIQGYYSPGDWTEYNRSADYQKTRFDASADYLYGRIEAERQTKLPVTPNWRKKRVDECYSWALNATLQLANGNLLPSEQLGVGGYATVRGYDERLASGDNGWIINNELRTPMYRLGDLLGTGENRDGIQFLVFYDLGSASLIDTEVGEDPHANLASVGGGLRFVISRNLSLRFDYGFQLSDRDLSAKDSRKDSRAHIAVLASF